MSLDDNVFPQDGDPNDEAFFAQLVSHDQLSDYVASGLDVDVDFNDYEATISSGVCYVSRDESVAHTDDVEMSNVGYAVQVSGRDVPIPTSGEFVIGVEPDFDVANSVSVSVYAEESQISDDGLLIARGDSDAKTYEETNRYPGVSFDVLGPSELLTIPSVSTVSDLDDLMVPEDVDVSESAIAYVESEEMLYTFNDGDGSWELVSDEQRLSDIEDTLDTKLDESDYTPEDDTHDRYTDTEAIEAVDGEVSESTNTVSQLDLFVSNLSDDVSGLDGDVSTLEDDISGKADDPHGNEAHSETFAVDGDSQPPKTHGNEAHDEEYITEADVDGGAPSPHGNDHHDPNFAEADDVFSGSYDDLFDVPNEFEPETHDNDAHDVSYVTTPGAREAVNDLIGASDDYTDIEGLDEQVVTNVDDISDLQSDKLDASDAYTDTDAMSAADTVILTGSGLGDGGKGSELADLSVQVDTNVDDIEGLDGAVSDHADMYDSIWSDDEADFPHDVSAPEVSTDLLRAEDVLYPDITVDVSDYTDDDGQVNNINEVENMIDDYKDGIISREALATAWYSFVDGVEFSDDEAVELDHLDIPRKTSDGFVMADGISATGGSTESTIRFESGSVRADGDLLSPKLITEGVEIDFVRQETLLEYVDEPGDVIGTSELLDVIDDWRDDEVSDELLSRAIDYWRNETPVAVTNAMEAGVTRGAMETDDQIVWAVGLSPTGHEEDPVLYFDDNNELVVKSSSSDSVATFINNDNETVAEIDSDGNLNLAGSVNENAL